MHPRPRIAPKIAVHNHRLKLPRERAQEWLTLLMWAESLANGWTVTFTLALVLALVPVLELASLVLADPPP